MSIANVRGILDGIESTQTSVPGSIWVDQLHSNVVVVHYNYNLDGISGPAFDQFDKWLEHALTRIEGNLKFLRWKLADHQDCSGGGDCFGSLVFTR